MDRRQTWLFAAAVPLIPFYAVAQDWSSKPVRMLVPSLLCAGANFPPNTLKEMIDYAKARPGQLNYSNPIGKHSYLSMLDFLSKAGMQIVNVPSKGAG